MNVVNWVAVAGTAAGDMLAFTACNSMMSHSSVARMAAIRRCSTNVVRNVGIMAHIDAGKTTTTERMLFQSGYMSTLGEVHTGDTVMDYMSQERERGITINSAAITFPWKKHQVNLIDTPGHVDFTMEVERCLRVLDGGIVVLDSSAGVEAQTITVWRQASKYSVPKIAFLNKMDKPNADFGASLESIKSKLGSEPLLIQHPIGSGKNFRGIIDIVGLKLLVWDKDSTHFGRNFNAIPITAATENAVKIMEERSRLIDTLCDFDDDLASTVIEAGNYNSVTEEDVYRALRKLTLDTRGHNYLVTLCGSAYKNIGVQPLLDSAVRLLPSPDDVPKQFLNHYSEDDLVALAFKTTHHPQKGILTFVRIYSGKISEGQTVHNLGKESNEKVGKLMVAFADDFRAVKEIGAGGIAVISGLKETVTGDTIVKSKTSGNDAMSAWKKSSKTEATCPLLSGVSVPDPVFYCSIEPPSMRFQKQLDLALPALVREDPSLRVWADKDTGQTVIAGMGELHIDIIKDRILREHKIDADIGPLMIAYRETAVKAARDTITFERNMLNKKYSIVIDLEISLPADGSDEKTGKQPKLEWSQHGEAKERSESLRPWQVKELKRGFANAVCNGPILGFPVLDTTFILHGAEVATRGTPESLVAAAMTEAVMSVLKSADARLLEPVMSLEITSDVDMAGSIGQDLIKKRGSILHSEQRGGMQVLTANAPLSELRGYSNHLRKMTSGSAHFGMEFSHYDVMGELEQDRAIEEVTGFAPAKR